MQPTRAALGLDPEPLGETGGEEKEAAEQQGAAVERRARAVTAGAGQETEAESSRSGDGDGGSRCGGEASSERRQRQARRPPS